MTLGSLFDGGYNAERPKTIQKNEGGGDQEVTQRDIARTCPRKTGKWKRDVACEKGANSTF